MYEEDPVKVSDEWRGAEDAAGAKKWADIQIATLKERGLVDRLFVFDPQPELGAVNVSEIKTQLCDHYGSMGPTEKHFIFWKERITHISKFKREKPLALPYVHQHVYHFSYRSEELINRWRNKTNVP